MESARWMARWLLGFLGLVILLGFYGCPESSNACNKGTPCPNGLVCRGQRCVFGDVGGCTSDTHCGEGRVCDVHAGKSGFCFDKCAADSDCGPGNICDASLGRCTCKPADCDARDGGGKFGCHPVLYTCEAFCRIDSDCSGSDLCYGNDGKKHCLNPREVKVCAADKDCKTGEKCDLSSKDARCVPASSSCLPSSCLGKIEGICDLATGKCVECLVDTDCTGAGETCNIDGKCEG